jgi:hypothetical protein
VSERNKDGSGDADDDRDGAVIAADDTGMLSNEINIVEVETEEGLDGGVGSRGG